MRESIPYYSAAHVHAALEYPALIEQLQQWFAKGAKVPLRHAHQVNEQQNDRLLLMPAWRDGEALGVKIVTAFPGNAARGVATVAATYVLLDGASGHPLAWIDGEALTLRRTAAASALASRYLSRPDSRTLLVVGTGKLAPYMAAAHSVVRRFANVLVWGRSPEKARALASRLADEGWNARPAIELRQALSEADVVTCATTAATPVVHGDQVRPGTHVDLVGGFTPTMREADDALAKKSSIYVDTYVGALAEGGDVVEPIKNGTVQRSDVRAELAELCRGEKAGRVDASEITLFKSVGTALEDLAAATLVCARG